MVADQSISTHNNQPKTGGRCGGEKVEEARSSGSVGGAQINRFGGDRVGSMLKTIIKLLSLQIIILPFQRGSRGGVSRFAKAMLP